MKGMKFFGKKAVSGLDLGHGWTKVVRLQQKRSAIALERVARRCLTNEDREKADTLAAGLKTMFNDLELRDRSVVTSLAGHSVIIKHIDAPVPENPKKKKVDIEYLASQNIPFDIKDVFLDFHIAEAGSTDSTRNIMLVASKKSMVLELQKTVSTAGMGTMIVDVDGFALNNCFEFNYPEHHDEAVYLLDIGSIQSIFCVHANQYPAFIRDAGFGGQHLTKRLSTLLDLQQQETENLKMNGFDHLDLKTRRKINQELDDVFSSWAEEIQRLIHFYRNTKGADHQVKRLYLSGGGSLIPGLPESLASALGLDVNYLDPWKEINVSDSQFDHKYLQGCGPQFSVATGLGLRSLL